MRTYHPYVSVRGLLNPKDEEQVSSSNPSLPPGPHPVPLVTQDSRQRPEGPTFDLDCVASNLVIPLTSSFQKGSMGLQSMFIGQHIRGQKSFACGKGTGFVLPNMTPIWLIRDWECVIRNEKVSEGGPISQTDFPEVEYESS